MTAADLASHGIGEFGRFLFVSICFTFHMKKIPRTLRFRAQILTHLYTHRLQFHYHQTTRFTDSLFAKSAKFDDLCSSYGETGAILGGYLENMPMPSHARRMMPPSP
jgi:hypothetical protein